MQNTSHSPIQRLDYENLDVYRCAINFLAFAFDVINGLQRGDGELRDQRKRAAISVVLNIAEGRQAIGARPRSVSGHREGLGHGVRGIGRRVYDRWKG